MAAGRHAFAGVALLAAALGAPPAAVAFTCEAAGGRPWRELTSEHFVVATDLDADDARELVEDLERIRGAVSAVLLPGRSAIPGRLGVVAFRSPDDLEEHAAPHVVAFYATLGPEERAIVLHPFPGRLAGRRGASIGEVVAHELTHHLLSYGLARRPAWLNEGLASVLEPLGSLGPGDPLEVGRVPASRSLRTRRSRVPVAELLAWDGRWDDFHMERHYDSSWLLVHFLLNHHPEGLSDLMRRLALGEDPGPAWAASFPAWDPGRAGALGDLEDDLDMYALSTALPFRRLPPPAGAPPAAGPAISARALPPAEIHALRIRLWSYRRSNRDPAALRAEVTEALAEDPGQPDALAALARLDGSDPVAAARRATAAHPGDARAWQLLAQALVRGPVAERLAARERAAALAPDDPAVLAGLTRDLVAAGRSGTAMPLVRRMLAAAPHSWGVHAAAASAASDLGACRDAVSLQRRALDLFPERALPSLRDELASTLASYARQCAPAPETETPRPEGGGASDPAGSPAIRD
jgi:hypothetical protein